MALGLIPAMHDCYSRKATMGRELMAPRTDHTTRIPSGVTSPVTTNHAAKGSVFVNLRNGGNLQVVIKSAKLIPTMALGLILLRRSYSFAEYSAAVCLRAKREQLECVSELSPGSEDQSMVPWLASRSSSRQSPPTSTS